MLACPNHPNEYEVRRCSRCARSYCKNCLVLLRGSYYCADCKTEQVRDVQSGTAGVRLEYASIGSRFLAMLIDNLIMGCGMAVVIVPLFVLLFGGMAASMPGERGGEPPPEFMIGFFAVYGLTFVISIVVPVVYEGVLLSRDGQTPGKKAMGLKVVTPEGNDISRGQAWGRGGMRLAIGFACALIDYVPAFFNDEKQCLHDMVASTRVVRL